MSDEKYARLQSGLDDALRERDAALIQLHEEQAHVSRLQEAAEELAVAAMRARGVLCAAKYELRFADETYVREELRRALAKLDQVIPSGERGWRNHKVEDCGCIEECPIHGGVPS